MGMVEQSGAGQSGAGPSGSGQSGAGRSGKGRPAGRNANVSLTADELAELREALDQGRNPTVYMREAIAGLGVPAGASAKVQSIDGTSVVVKPRRVDDALPFEAHELRMTKQAPPEPVVKKPAAQKPAQQKPAQQKPAVQKPAGQKQTQQKQTRQKTGATGKNGAEIVIAGVVEPDGANTWTVTVTGGGSRSVKPVPVGAEAVVAAMSALGVPRAGKAVYTVVEAAREQAERRVEELSRELAEAKKALRSLKK